MIGFQFNGNLNLENMSFIVDDRCRPKYFGVRTLSLRLGQRREVRFDWQASDADHYSTCLSHGLLHVQNSGKLAWVTVTGNKATLFPSIQDVYPSTSYLSLFYGGETLLLELSPFILYTIPVSPTNPRYPLITSYFTDVKEGWLPSRSTFKFSDSRFDYNGVPLK